MSETVDPREETKELERKADAIRRDVDMLIREADKRRQQFFGVSSRLREHPAVVIGAAGLIGMGVFGVSLLLKRRYEQRHSLSGKLTALGAAMGRVAKKPERVGRQEPDLGYKLLMAAGTAVVGALARRGVTQLMTTNGVRTTR
ncbi:MAG TPA: hypothetical protein VGG33_11750 [Polyangia bacterium]